MIEAECPARLFHEKEERVEVIGGNRYQCTCGTVFTWDGQFRWHVLESPYAIKGRLGVQEDK